MTQAQLANQPCCQMEVPASLCCRKSRPRSPNQLPSGVPGVRVSRGRRGEGRPGKEWPEFGLGRTCIRRVFTLCICDYLRFRVCIMYVRVMRMRVHVCGAFASARVRQECASESALCVRMPQRLRECWCEVANAFWRVAKLL